MKVKEELLKTMDALKSAGFEPVDAVFRGMVVVMEKSTLDFIQELADKQEAMGSIVLFYKNQDGEVRTIELPVGEVEENEEEEKEKPP